MSHNLSISNWRLAGFSTSILIILLFWLHRDTIFSLIHSWNDLKNGDTGHGYLVLLVSLYIIFRIRQELLNFQPCPSYLGIFFLLTISFLWILSTITNVVILQSICLLLFILSIALTVLGKKVTKKLLFPIAFIGFAIPFWQPITPFLRDLSADIVYRIIRFLDIPAFLEGTRIILPSGRLTVTDGCSGTRYAIPALALGILYSYLNYQRLGPRLLVVFISFNAALLINIIRILIVVYFAYKTEMQHYFIHNHFALGWYLFAGIVICLLLIDVILNRYFITPDIKKEKADTESIYTECNKGKSHHLVILFIVSTTLIATPIFSDWILNKTVSVSKHVEIDFPKITKIWKGPLVNNNNWMPVFRGANNFKKSYQKDQEFVDFYIGHYQKQKQGKELIYYVNSIANKDIWHFQKPRHNFIKSRDHTVIEQLIEDDKGDKRLVWFWYQVAGIYTINSYTAKGLQVIGLFTGNTQASVTAISVIIKDNIESSRKLLEEFMSTLNLPMLPLE